MENEFRVIDIVLAVILVVVMFVGIGIFIGKRANDPNELTIENYEEYISIRTGFKTVSNGTEYSIVFTPTERFKVTDVNATIYVQGLSISSQTLNVSFSATRDEPYVYTVVLKSQQPSYSDLTFDWFKIDYSITAISGQLSRG